MKKIFISLAAIAALASCVEEKGLEPQPQQPVGNQVTIKAVAAETKTVLGQDGTSVVWEEDDQIKVVLESKVQFEEVVEDFSVSGELNGSSANFTGEFDTTVEVDEGVHPYAVYPASAVAYDESTGKVSITHTLPEVQNGTIESGMMLSSAILSAEAMENGTSTATFHNALTLLKIIVPEGVKSVSLTSGNDNLVGKVTATADFTDRFNIYEGEEHYDVLPATGKLTLSKSGTNKTVTLSNDGNALEAGIHSVLVYPGYVGLLTLNLEGTDGAELQASLLEITFNASEYRTINLSSIFNIGVEETEYISPLGGDVTVPIVSTEQYDYNVTTADPWLTYTKTKALNSQEFTFSAGENVTGKVRETTATISWTGGSKTFKVSQNGYEPGLFNDYLESYRYNGSTYTGGKLNIGISDDFSKGTYKVTGFLTRNQYSYTFYAEYADNKLTLKTSSQYGYYGNVKYPVVLDVSDDFKTISNNSFNLSDSYSFLDYKAVITLGPAELTAEEEALVGIYDEAYNYTNWSGSGQSTVAGSMTISASEEASYGQLKVTFLGYNYTSFDGSSTLQRITSYADLSSDGNSLVIYAKGIEHETFGPLDENVTLTISDGVLSCSTMTAATESSTISNYTATKQASEEGGDDDGDEGGDENAIENIVNAVWSQSGTSSMLGQQIKDNIVTFVKIDATHVKITNLFGNASIASAVFNSSDMTLTIPAGWQHTFAGSPETSEIVFNVSADYNTITCASTLITIDGYMDIADYKLTKKVD